MYWKVSKIGPEQVVRQYGVHAALIFSVLLNLLLITTRPTNPKVSAETKQGFEEFARNVTLHLLDTSYITYSDSTVSLLTGELAPPVIGLLRQQDMLAKNEDELRATAKTLTEQRQISAVKIDRVLIGEPDNRGLVPVQVSGLVAIHSAEESGPTGPVPFDFKYTIGARVGPDGKAMFGPDGKTPIPMVAMFQDASPKAQQ